MPWFPPCTEVAMSGDWPRGWYKDESDQPDAGGQVAPGSPGYRAQPNFTPSSRGPGGARDWYGASGWGHTGGARTGRTAARPLPPPARLRPRAAGRLAARLPRAGAPSPRDPSNRRPP